MRPPQAPWRTVDELELGTLSWVHWFNESRLHSALGWVPPVDYEAAWAEANTSAPTHNAL